MSDRYPLMMYLGPDAENWHIVDGEEEESEASSQGWRLTPYPHPLDHDGDGKKGGSLDELDHLTDEELRAMILDRGASVHHRTGRHRMLQILREAA